MMNLHGSCFIALLIYGMICGTVYSNSISATTGLNSVEVGSHFFTIAWNTDNDSRYKVVVQDHGYPSPTKSSNIGLVTESPYQVTTTITGKNIQPNTRYDVYLFATTSGGSKDDYTSVSFLSEVTAFEMPRNVSIEDSTPSTILVSWLAPAHDGKSASMDSYRVSWSPASSDGSTFADVKASTTEMKMLGLSPNTNYEITVVAKSSARFGSVSDVTRGTTTFEKPTKVEVIDSTSSTIHVSWEPPGNAGSATVILAYIISWVPADNAGFMVILGSDVTEVKIPGLTSNTKYDIAVAAQSSAGIGEYSETVPGTTIFSQPSLKVTGSTFKTIDIAWDAPSNGGNAERITGYQITYNGDTTTVSNPEATKTTLDSLLSNKKYTIKIAAQTTGVEGEISDAVEGITTHSKPTNLDPGAITSSTIDLIWEDPSPGGGAMRIFEYVVSWSSPENNGSLVVPRSPAHIPDLTSNTRYFLSVSARSQAGTGEISDLENAVTIHSPPTDVSISGSSSTSMTIKWTKSETGGGVYSIDDYLVSWLPKDNGGTKSVAADETTVDLTHLISNTEYSITITPQSTSKVDGETCGAIKGLTNFAAPESLTMVTSTSSTIDISWDEPEVGGNATSVIEYTVSWSSSKNSGSLVVSNSIAHIPGLISNSNYDVAVAAISLPGKGESSAILTTTTFTKPTEVQVISSTSSTLNIDWTAPSGGGDAATIEGYTISWSEMNYGNFSFKYFADASTAAEIEGLNSNTQFFLTIEVHSNRGEDGDISDRALGITRVAAPSSISVTDKTSSSIDLNWSTPKTGGNAVDVVGYLISWSPVDGGGSLLLEDPTANSTSITYLYSNTEYTYVIFAQTTGENGDSSDEQNIITNIEKPAKVVIEKSTSTSVDVSWTASEIGGNVLKINSYEVQWRLLSNPSDMPQSKSAGNSLSYTIPDLDSNTDYDIFVYAKSSDIHGDSSNSAAGTTTFAQPTNLTQVSSRSSTLDMNWSAPAVGGNANSVNGYVISWLSGGDQGSTLFYGSATTAHLTDLNSSTDYILTIRAQSIAGDGQLSEKENSKTAPPAPHSVVLSNPYSTSIDIAWAHAVVGDTHHYRVMCTAPGDNQFVCGKTVDTSVMNLQISDLTASTLYHITVVAVVSIADDIESDESDEVALSTGPSAPFNVHIVDARSTELDVIWEHEESPNTEKYRVFYRSAEELNEVHVETEDTSTKALTISELTSNTEYFITIVAVGSGGVILTDRSEEIIAMTGPDPPSNVKIEKHRATELDVTWKYDDADTTERYRVKYHKTADSNMKIQETKNSNQYLTLTDLEPNTEYILSVAAIGEKDKIITDMSAEIPGTTVPDVPLSVVVSLGTNKTKEATVTFVEPLNGASGYVANFAFSDDSSVEFLSENTPIYADNLIAGETYNVTVKGWNKAGEGVSSETTSITMQPNSPSNLRVVSTTSNSSTIKWIQPSEVFDDYKIYFGIASGDLSLVPFEQIKNVSATSVTITGLDSNTEYTFSITALSGDGKLSTESVQSNFAKGTTTPGTPLNVVVVQGADSTTEAEVEFEEPKNGASKYEATFSVSDETNKFYSPSSPISANSLTSGQKYEVIVKGNNTAGYGADSDVASIRMDPKPPSDLNVAFFTNTASLSWTKPAGIFTKYNIYYSNGSELLDLVPSSQISYETETSCKVTSLASNTAYAFAVTAVSGTDSDFTESEYSNKVTDATDISQPTALTVTTTTFNTINITWMSPIGGDDAIITGYLVSWTPSDGTGSMSVIDGSNSATITGLNSNTDYSITVAAQSGNDAQGDTSEPVSGATAFSKPGTPSVTNSSPSTIDISWTAPDNGGGATTVTGYLVSWTPPDGTGSMSITDGSNSATITGLNSNTEYSVTVTAQSSVGDGEDSDKVQGITVPGKLDDPYWSSSTTSSITLQWHPVGGSVSGVTYAVTWNPAAKDGTTTGVNISDTTFTVEKLNSNVHYTFIVTAVNDGGSGISSNPVSFSTVPDKANLPSRTSATENSIVLQWNAVNGSSPTLTYTVSWDPPSGDLRTGTKPNISETFTTINGLDSNIQYSFTVQATNDGGVGEASETAKFSTVPGKANPPSSNGATNTTISIQWSPVDGFSPTLTYTVTWDPASADEITNTKSYIKETSTTITGLTPTTEYAIIVTAVNDAGSGLASRAEMLYTAPRKANAPLMTSATTTSISLQWEVVGTSSSALNYTVHWDPPAADGQTTIEKEIPTNEVTITGLTPNTQYSFTVKAVNKGGNGEYSDPSKFSTVPQKPDPPKKSTATTTSITLQWNKVAVTSPTCTYVVRWDPESADGTTNTKPNINGVSIIIDNLSPNIQYRFILTAVNDGGRSNHSDPVFISTVPEQATSPLKSSTTATSVTLQWDAVPGNSPTLTYIVKWNPAAKDRVAYASTPDISATSTTIEGLDSNTQYDFSIEAKNDGGTGVSSDSVLITTVPDQVKPPTSTKATINSISLQWDQVHGSSLNYIISWDPPSDDGITNILFAVDAQTADVVGLNSNTQYAFIITAVGVGGRSLHSVPTLYSTVPEKMTSPTKTATTSTSISLQWLPVSGTSPTLTYKVTWDPASTDGNTTCDVITTSTVIDNLTPNEDYHITVSAYNDDWHGAVSNETLFFTVPDQVQGLFTQTQNSTSISLQWDPVMRSSSSALQYIVTWEPASADGITNTKSGITGTSTTVESLNSNAYYEFSVIAVNQGGRSMYSNSTSVSTVPGKTNAPSLSSSTTSTISLYWNAAEGSSSTLTYTVRWEPEATDEKTIETDIATTSTTINNLESNKQYTFTVTAVHDGGSRIDSDPSPFSTIPEQVIDLTPSNTTLTSIELQWEPVVGDSPTLSYTVTWDPASADGTTNTHSNIKDPKIIIDNLTSNTGYNFIVTAVNDGGKGFPSSSNSFSTFPERPKSPSVSSSTTKTVSLQWDPVAGSSSTLTYSVTWDEASEDGTTNTKPDITETSVTIAELKTNTDYTFAVIAVNDGGSSTTSDSVTYATLPQKVDAPTMSEATTDSITLQWVRVSGESSSGTYTVTWDPPSTVGDTIKSDIKEKITTIDKLNPNTNYKFIVAAANNAGIGLHSDVVQMSTTSEPPSSIVVGFGSNNKSEAVVTFLESESGASYYSAIFMPRSGNVVQNSSSSSPIVVNALEPGQTYNVTVVANNAAGDGLPSTAVKTTTYPDSVKNVVLKQDLSNPDTRLEITWDKPQGFGDAILIEYENEVKGDKNTVESNFDANSRLIDVVPGCNYTVSLTVSSNYLLSAQESRKMNSKPSKPVCNAIATVNELELIWDPPEGNFDGFVLIYDGTTEIYLHENIGTYKLFNLVPYSTYAFDLHSVINFDVSGNMEQSASNLQSFRTLAAPPEPPNMTTSATVQVGQETISYTLPENTFTDKNGPIEFYGVYVSLDDNAATAAPDVSRNESCSKLNSGEVRECVALWTDGNGQPITESVQEPGRLRRSYENPQSNPEILFVIGDGVITYSPWNEAFENVPLDPDTGYKVSVAAKTNNEELVPTQFSDSFVTEEVQSTASGANVVLIASLTAAVACAVIVVAIGVVYRGRQKKRNPKTRKNLTTNDVYDNQIFSMECPITSRPIKVVDFPRKIHSLDDAKVLGRISKEYLSLKEVGRFQATRVASAHQNLMKNRTIDFLPYDATRVILTPIDDDQSGSDYINASFIPGPNGPKHYIATQGPLAHTVDDFWRMVWEQNSRNIVMITQNVEKGSKICEHYWPSDSTPIPVVDMTLEMSSEFLLPEWSIRIFKLTKNGESRRVRQFQYAVWPGHSVPGTAESLFVFINCVHKAIEDEERQTGPTIVHCSDGVGRTGTFIAIDRLIQKLKENINVDIFGTIYDMRKARMSLVSSEDQYVLIYRMIYGILNNIYTEKGNYEAVDHYVQGKFQHSGSYAVQSV